MTEPNLEIQGGLRQKQLCEQWGWRYKDVARQAKTLGMATHEYVQQQTGWRLIKELYYPPLMDQASADSGEADENVGQNQ